MKIRHWDSLTRQQQDAIIARTSGGNDVGRLERRVRKIIEAVKAKGDSAALSYTAKFDGVDLRAAIDNGTLAHRQRTQPFLVSHNEFKEAEQKLTTDLKETLRYAIRNATIVHKHELPSSSTIKVEQGVTINNIHSPIQRIGIYVPSGKGVFPSMMVMAGVPAVVAQVPQIVVCTPPRADGGADPATLYVCKQLGIAQVYTLGGAQAVAAVAYGTDTVPAVDKLVGPGSGVVNVAKRLVSDVLAGGLIAGPSESMIIADENASPHVCALDLLIEAEHGNDSAAYLVTPSKELAHEVSERVIEMLPSIPERRRNFVSHVLQHNGGALVASSIEQAIDIANAFAPEHLKVDCRNATRVAHKITAAGEILIGAHSAFSIANYITGANAILPTNRWARTQSALSTSDFLINRSCIEVEKAAFTQLSKHVVRLAEYEGFHCHAHALLDKRRHIE